LKEKVKWPAEHTQMQVATFEYQMAVKDIYRCLIHKACCEVVKKGDTILNKYLAVIKKEWEGDCGVHILGI